MKLASLIAAALVLVRLAPAAHAQEMQQVEATPELLAQIDALPMQRLCSERGVFQYEWGSTELPPSLFSSPGLESYGLPPAAAPFRKVALAGTAWSNRFFMANYDLWLTDEKDVASVIEHFAQSFREAGWIERVGGLDDDGPMIDFPPGEGEVAFYSDAGGMDPERRTGIRASLTHIGSMVTLECVSMPLLVAQAAEAFGDIPVDTPKPVAPVLPEPEALDPAICATAEGIARIRSVLTAAPDTQIRSSSVLHYAVARGRYHQKLTDWKVNRLKKLGGVSGERILELVLSDVSFDSTLDNMAAIKTSVDAIAASEKAGDRAASCRALVAMLTTLRDSEADTLRQWGTINAALDAEAARLGVAFD